MISLQRRLQQPSRAELHSTRHEEARRVGSSELPRTCCETIGASSSDYSPSMRVRDVIELQERTKSQMHSPELGSLGLRSRRPSANLRKITETCSCSTH